MELKWITNKHTWNDVKNKEKVINQKEINYDLDLINSNKSLQKLVSERVEYAKRTGSRVQINSIVMYSNELTISSNTSKKWDDKTKQHYFEICCDYFKTRFGTENVISAKTYLKKVESFMILYFVPFNLVNGRLQARIAMNPMAINKIHDELPRHLEKYGFDVERAGVRTKNLKDGIEDLLDAVPDKFGGIPFIEMETTQVKVTFMKYEEHRTGNYILNKEQYLNLEKIVHAAVKLKKILLE